MTFLEINKGKALSGIILAALLLYVVYFLFYIPSDERKFVEQVGRAFEVQKADTVLLGDITDFEWDVVCYIAPYSTKSFNFIEDEYRNIVLDYLPAIPWPLFYGAYYFLKDNKLVEKYSFSSWGLRYSRNGWHPATVTLFIEDESHLFMGEHNTRNDSCIKRKDAAFLRQRLHQLREKRIVITNLKKE